MDKITNLIGLLGEENEKRIKDTVTNFIIDAVKDDIESYDNENFILNPDEIIEFITDCKEEAFKKMKDEIVNNMTEKIKMSL